MESQKLGRRGERIARQYLENKGYSVLASNYYCRYGELDIVARDRESLVFVEVKCRRSRSGLEQAVGSKKVRSLHLSAKSFMQKRRLEREDYRFMVLYILLLDGEEGPATIELLEEPF